MPADGALAVVPAIVEVWRVDPLQGVEVFIEVEPDGLIHDGGERRNADVTLKWGSRLVDAGSVASPCTRRQGGEKGRERGRKRGREVGEKERRERSRGRRTEGKEEERRR